ncbi:MAG: hypothetical protein M0D57_00155 [Sphingobacteriales bacterium JAD_PAG50586_3]|nr:MAG: hypothetical protein M0D57_00155 [Sphingobacteriales bacterium JAD_PAG50586_3]
MPGRTGSAPGVGYRFGFNGQERENEIAGIGSINTAEYWEYDSRTGRRWNIDPIDQISISNYATFSDNPIVMSDINGDSPTGPCPTCPDDPKQLYSTAPKIDMTSAPAGSAVNAAGYPRNGPWYWRQALIANPEMFSKNNVALIKAGISPTVDNTWIKYNPSHASYKGGPLLHHHIDQGKMAAGIPARAHLDYFKQLHLNLKGINIKSTMSWLGKAVSLYNIFSEAAALKTENPDALINLFQCFCDPEDRIGVVRRVGLDSDQYYTITGVTNHYKKDKDGEDYVFYKEVRCDVYSSYIWDDKQHKYIGAGWIESRKDIWIYNEDGSHYDPSDEDLSKQKY